MVKSIGADHMVDYTQTDFAKTGEQYDVVYETVDKAPYSSCIAAVKNGGTLLMGASMLGGMLQGAWINATSNKKVIFGVAQETLESVGLRQSNHRYHLFTTKNASHGLPSKWRWVKSCHGSSQKKPKHSRDTTKQDRINL